MSNKIKKPKKFKVKPVTKPRLITEGFIEGDNTMIQILQVISIVLLIFILYKIT